jgi:PAS domain S-box-containing protein
MMATSRLLERWRFRRRHEDRATPKRRRLRIVEWALQLGVSRGLPVDTDKRVRLCNRFALVAIAIMVPWLLVEAGFGDARNLPWELGFLAGFLGVLTLNGAGATRAARLALIATANGCVFAGALLFDRGAGGTLPLLALPAIPLLLFGRGERLLVVLGAVLPLLLFGVLESGAAAHLLGVHPRTAPPWYFAANAASAFAIGFLAPFLFYRANLRAEASLERIGQERLKRVIDSDLIGVVRGRLSGRIEDANDTFLSLLGYSRKDLRTGGLDLTAIAPLPALGADSVPDLAGLPRCGSSSVYERACRRKDGTTVPTLIGVARLDDCDGEVVGFVLDLSAQKHVEAQQEQLLESREALHLRDLFNSIASHELKTPLTALMLNLRLLRTRLEKEVPDNTGLRAQVRRCDVAATRMGDLIHALLDVAQIHDGRLSLTVADTDVGDAVRRAVSGFEASGSGGPQHIVVDAEGPMTAKLDSLRFDQVVTNLLSNAVKYGSGRPIEVHVRHGQAADVARVEVIDRGPGIDPAMTQRIFEPFQRASSAESIPGLGLGLYVVKMIVEGHGGRIGVESQPGRGSRFIVDLPCAAQP